MYRVARKVKIATLLLIVFCLALGIVLVLTLPIELAQEERISTSSPTEVLQLTQHRVAWSNQYLLFFWFVPTSLKQYPQQAIAAIQTHLQRYQTTTDPFLRQQAEHSVRYHSKLAFETVDGQIRKARNATVMVMLGLGLFLCGSIFLFFHWLRFMFGFMVVGTFCVCLPIKDQPWSLSLLFFAPTCFLLISWWLIRDNPGQKLAPVGQP